MCRCRRAGGEVTDGSDESDADIEFLLVVAEAELVDSDLEFSVSPPRISTKVVGFGGGWGAFLEGLTGLCAATNASCSW